MCKHILNAQVSIRSPCCRKWFDCAECHAEQEDHPLMQSFDMRLRCPYPNTSQPNPEAEMNPNPKPNPAQPSHGLGHGYGYGYGYGPAEPKSQQPDIYERAKARARVQATMLKFEPRLAQTFICKKCRKAFRKNTKDWDESDEYCPNCDNHFVIEAATPKAALKVESDDVRVDAR
ncbi:hypothetical protein A1O3_00454 [Capronia epimyces CBS 606.96]|uniref:CHY-type domain-containing protein n=1 Tax=Capronia epimyces CBS 606.96 TaxID=1182542 RepID=W9ZBM8_9EURO|nr:uncharacterized protein A1O3_00454 [Capronia epimyces CBS 606.96]EXJ91904.1 hypothetical protein A1O3_00454 [Capronia epimyces CBS 606.96]